MTQRQLDRILPRQIDPEDLEPHPMFVAGFDGTPIGAIDPTPDTDWAHLIER